MRAGGCAVQQTLTAEAAGLVKHAVALAQQRGHAQVTPLHVAATLLAPGTMSLLRRACLKSHPNSTSHPLQCRALELCFSVALNRLPSTAGPLVHSGQPSLSNSLVAVLKRAQAHQRRGCLEQQQQPLLAMKVEIEQLVISILDDPSVSRVMREAGFSSTFVKSNIEDEVSVSVSVSANFPYFSMDRNHTPNEISVPRSAASEMGSSVLYSDNNNSLYNSSTKPRINFFESPAFKSHRSSGSLRNEDVGSVFEVFLGKKTRKTNSVIVGDCFLTTENVVREVMSRVERGDVPDLLKGVQFITPHFSSLVRGEEVGEKLAELRRTVVNCLARGSAIIYAGDLRWAVDVLHENGDNNNSHSRIDSNNYSCPVDEIIIELGRILCIHGEGRRVWLMATSTYQTYMRCQARQPSLESLWGLQAVPVPGGGLTLTLQPGWSNEAEPKSDGGGGDVLLPIPQNLLRRMPPLNIANSDNEMVEKLNCCFECSANFEAEAKTVCKKEQSFPYGDRSLPFWLHQSGNDNVCKQSDAADQEQVKLKELRKKWNQTCRSRHCHIFDLQLSSFEFPHHPKGAVSSVIPHSPWWFTPQNHHAHGVGASLNKESSLLSNTLSVPDCSHNQLSWQTFENGNGGDSSLKHTVKGSTRFDVETTLTLGLSDTNFKASNNCTVSSPLVGVPSFGSTDSKKSMRQSNRESIKELSDRLGEKVPWQSEENVLAIASAVLHCRSGNSRRDSRINNVQGDAWLLALGSDRMGKRKMAQALAEIIYGSRENLISLANPWSRGHIYQEAITHSCRGKTYIDRLAQAINTNPHCVVLLQDIDQADTVFMGAIVKAMERGKLVESNGREVSLCDSIVFMTSSVHGAKYFTNYSSLQYDEHKLEKSIAGPSCGFKLVIVEERVEQVQEKLRHHSCKRKVEWDPIQAEETEKRNRQSPGLDLNTDSGNGATAAHDEAGSMSGNSDVTEETVLQTDALSDQILFSASECFSQQFLKSLDKCVVFRPFDFSHLAETTLDKLHHSYYRASNGRGSLQVESSVLERIVSCCWDMAPFHTQIFENWVDEIFEVGLAQMLSMQSLTEKTTVILSDAETNDGDSSFYGDSRLPTRIEVNSCSNCESMADEFTVCRMHKHLSSTKALMQVHV